jgi:hypothetical protein
MFTHACSLAHHGVPSLQNITAQLLVWREEYTVPEIPKGVLEQLEGDDSLGWEAEVVCLLFALL